MTAGKQKFSAFGGVFTPSILTILGVIMYLRLGWVVGHAGLWGSILIVIIAHVISITTGLSISSIATDKKVGAGGVYYVLSRSLGLPIGGAIGLTLFVGTALSIALYIVGFSESFNGTIGITSDINSIRITGSLALVALTIIAFISTSLAIKTQYFILAAIFVSLVVIFLGSPGTGAELLPATAGSEEIPLEAVFAIFFPAVTGFTAGIAMSGDLKDPKKSIPLGTISAIGVGFIVYLALVVFLGLRVDHEMLKSDYNILMKIALFAPAVVAGIWGATLSSALGGILGGPRILQAMSLDKITPGLFAKEKGKTKEPRYALIAAIILAECGILIGDLDIVARIVSMFYLAAYGFINISFFLESWASSDFRPSFKVSKWFGFIGFVATFGIMFKLDMLAMFLALIVIGGIYLWLARREIALGTGDIWQSVWSTGIKEGLKRLESKKDHKRNWKPNILLFSGNSEARPYLVAFSQALAGRSGLVTNFDLIENPGMEVLFPKHKQSVRDELLQKYGIFGRRIEVKNVYKGIESIATTFGFSGLDPNTVLMGWARNTKDPIWFAQATQKLIDLDYNVLYLDYDHKRGFGNHDQIDLWWRGISNNAELMLQLAKFLSFNSDWRNAHIRILLVNDFNVDRRIIETRIAKLMDEFRLNAEIKVIENHLEQKPFYSILKAYSLKSDLVLIGIPFIIEGSESSFVRDTNDLTEVIGTTLLVKASTTFDTTKLGLKQIAEDTSKEKISNLELKEIKVPGINTLKKHLQLIDQKLEICAETFAENCLKVITQHYHDFITRQEQNILKKVEQYFSKGAQISDPKFLQIITSESKEFRDDMVTLLSEILSESIEQYQIDRKEVLTELDKTIQVTYKDLKEKERKVKLPWKKTVLFYDSQVFPEAISKAYRDLGSVSSSTVIQCKELIKKSIEALFSGVAQIELTRSIHNDFAQIVHFTHNIITKPIFTIRQCDRKICNMIASIPTVKEFNKNNTIGLFFSVISINRKQENFIKNYASYWLRNQVLFHHRFETGIELKRTNLILSAGAKYLIDTLQENPTQVLLEAVRDVENNLDVLQKSFKTGSPDNIDAQIFEGTVYHMFDYIPLLMSFKKRIGKSTENLPSEIEMMDTGSNNDMDIDQGDGIQTVSFSVDKIADYLIETKFISSVQENLTTLTRDINTVIGDYLNLKGRLVYDLNLHRQSLNSQVLPTFIEKYRKQLKQLSGIIKSTYVSFAAEINEKRDATISLLDVQHIIEQADVLTQYVRRQDIRSGIGGKIQDLRVTVTNTLKRSTGFVAEKKDVFRQIEFEKENKRLINIPDTIRAFVDSISLKPEIREALPFYYQQLFSGKHLHTGKLVMNRASEIEKVKKAIQHIEEGAHGAIMITGPTLSGKTFFTENIVNQHLHGNSYYISPPTGGAISMEDLESAIRGATGKKGPIKQILKVLEYQSAIVFNDLELWWLNTYRGDVILNAILDLIKNFGDRHFFILNTNLHTLHFLNKTTDLSEVLVTTILLRPLSREEVRNELLKRHKIGGISLYFRGVRIEAENPDRQLDKLFTRIHTLSKGNIGFAFSIWLSCIRIDENGAYFLEMPPLTEFPELDDPDWNSVLLQLLLHNSISIDRFKKLYKSNGVRWTTRMEREIRSSLIMTNPSGEKIKLKKWVRPWVEDWLNEKGIL